MTRERSKRSGRAVLTSSVDEGNHAALVTELVGVANRVAAESPAHADEVAFAVAWAEAWYGAYDAGHADLLTVLNAVRAGSARVPGPWRRVILGVVAHKATYARPVRLGEHKPKVPPEAMRLVGQLVQQALVGEDGKPDGTTIEAAVQAVMRFITERGLLEPLPQPSVMKEWWEEWRTLARKAGHPVPPLRRGRPPKDPA